MIYIGNVRPSIMNESSDKNIVDFFKGYEAPTINIPKDSKTYDNYKQFEIKGFISGEMVSNVRKNENLLSRDCLILDLDDVIISEKEMLEVFKQKFSNFDYIAYPSLGHKVKGVRYRLILPLNKNVNDQEYKQLIIFFSKVVLKDVIGEVDKSNVVWSQIQLLPVLTEYTSKEQILINETGKLLPVSECLTSAANFIKSSEKEMRVVSSKTSNRYRSSTTRLFESLVSGCSLGGRNNKVTEITGGLLARSVDIELVWELIQVANHYFNPPLEIEELEKTFFSIAKKELKS